MVTIVVQSSVSVGIEHLLPVLPKAAFLSPAIGEVGLPVRILAWRLFSNRLHCLLLMIVCSNCFKLWKRTYKIAVQKYSGVVHSAQMQMSYLLSWQKLLVVILTPDSITSALSCSKR